ncbi:Alpha-1,3-mannosyltransferase CMT1 [Cytospora mali]|uniref:Alpha-1,3-mannosyltransferase CMT1 n=1 Tax=Cytospora mali TaxID=578113 RepID=A0A194VAZ4_CYTMA|nr:Alpha-1,3-mannosyltransferase CMT1 [Valsa mali var. pyri (nom. inval.)]
MRQTIIIGGQIAVLSLVVLLILCYRDALAETFEPIQRLFPKPGKLYTSEPFSPGPPNMLAPEYTPSAKVWTPIDVGEKPASQDSEEAEVYVEAEPETPKVLDDVALLARYETLKAPADITTDSDSIKYFFALDLTQVVELLPRLLGSIVETIRFLGPENCALSIVEGNSDDGTPEVLAAIRPEIEALGTEYFFQSSDVNPKEGEGQRIVSLAKLRNLALQPLLDDARRYSADSTVVFLNDVAICMEDILELVYQRSFLGADMTCAMDWTYVGRDPTFYDIWISRTMTGESFFKIPEDGSWDYAWNLFWEDNDTKSRYSAHLPFQVFSCWNGAVTFTAELILNREVLFRSNKPGECFQGEPELFCKDMWYKGWNKIAVVPSVNLEYTDDRGKDLKALKGYTSSWVGPEQDEKSKIDWNPNPPDQVKCMEVLERPEWRPWNETLSSAQPSSTRRTQHKWRR